MQHVSPLGRMMAEAHAMLDGCEAFRFGVAGKRSIEVAAKAFGFTAEEIVSDRRTARLVKARHIAMWLMRETTPRSLPVIGRRFRRDHSTVFHALKRVDKMRNKSPKTRALIDRLKVEVVGP